MPVLVQRSVALGRFEKLDAASAIMAIAVGVLSGVVLTLFLNFVLGALLHLLVNVWLRAGGDSDEAVLLPFLCMAPYLILVLEFPALILDFGEESTFLIFAVLRLVAGVLTFRVLYWGLRRLFGLSRRAALGVTMLPVAVVVLITIPMVRGALR